MSICTKILDKDKTCNIQKKNEFLKDSVWVKQWTVWRQSKIVGHQLQKDGQEVTKEKNQEKSQILISISHQKQKGLFMQYLLNWKNWFQRFSRSTWFYSRFKWRGKTCFVSSWSTSTSHRVSIFFRNAHKWFIGYNL